MPDFIAAAVVYYEAMQALQETVDVLDDHENLIAAGIISAVSEIANRYPRLGALPLTPGPASATQRLSPDSRNTYPCPAFASGVLLASITIGLWFWLDLEASA